MTRTTKKLQFVPHDMSMDDDGGGGCSADVSSGGGSGGTTSTTITKTTSSAFTWELCYLRGTWQPFPPDKCLLLEGDLPAPAAASSAAVAAADAADVERD